MSDLAALWLAVALQAPPAAGGVAATGAAPAAAPAAPAADPGRRICRRIPQTGSRLGGASECLTAAQWRERGSAEAQSLRDAQSHALQLRPQ